MAINIVGGTVQASAALALNAQTGTTYTFVLADADNKLVTANNASAQTYSIPTKAEYCSHNSSAVSLGSVFTRQDCVNLSLLKTPRTVLVLPTSIVSNIIFPF